MTLLASMAIKALSTPCVNRRSNLTPHIGVRPAVVLHLFAMAVALSLGAILLGVAADRARRRSALQ
jgi:hypothetical protein